MANTALAHSTFEQISSLSQLNIVRQVGFMLLMAAAIALGTAVVMWSRDPDYTVLFPDLTPQDSSEVVSALDQAAVDYRIDAHTGLVTVPADKVQQLRLQLASQGLPHTTATGFDMLYEDSSLGTSNFIEQARYNRALELELVKTIKLIRGVRDARVHLSIPKQSTFLRSSNKASASVMLDLVAGQSINDTQIAGIGHLVASSVAGLDADNVSMVDQKGNLLSQQKNGEFNSTNEQMQYTRNLEAEYSQRIIDILTPVIGEGKVRAQVTADLDFTIVETTNENYNPANSALRSEQTSDELRGGTGGSPSAGSLSPTPPTLQPDGSIAATPAPTATATANTNANANTQQSSTATRNYELDKSTSYIRSVPGSIKRLTVAVLVDIDGAQVSLPADGSAAAEVPTGATPDKIARLTQLVKDTIGYSEVRGDSVNLISEPFSAQNLFEESQPMPIWEQAWVPGALKQLAASLVVLMLIFAVLRPALKSVVVTAPKPVQGLVEQHHHNNSHHSNNHNHHAAQNQPLQVQTPQVSEYDQNLSLAQSLVENEPARAARMIKEWIGND